MLLFAILLTAALAAGTALDPTGVHTRRGYHGVRRGFISGGVAARDVRRTRHPSAGVPVGAAVAARGSGGVATATRPPGRGGGGGGPGPSNRATRPRTRHVWASDLRRVARGSRTAWLMARAFTGETWRGYKTAADEAEREYLKKYRAKRGLPDPDEPATPAPTEAPPADTQEAPVSTTADVPTTEDIGEFPDSGAMEEAVEDLLAEATEIDARRRALAEKILALSESYQAADFSTTGITATTLAAVETIQDGYADERAFLEIGPHILEALEESARLGEHGQSIGAEGDVESHGRS